MIRPVVGAEVNVGSRISGTVVSLPVEVGDRVVAINGGEAIEPSLAFKFFLVFVVFTFYAWFWHKSGQTLGMRAWRIRIVSEFGGNPSWGVAYLRLVFALLSWACFGLGYWWRLFKPYTWHDRLSQTRIVLDRSGRDDPPSASDDV